MRKMAILLLLATSAYAGEPYGHMTCIQGGSKVECDQSRVQPVPSGDLRDVIKNIRILLGAKHG